MWTKVRVDPNLDENSLSGHFDFSHLNKKSQVSIFGTDLEAIWKFKIFGYLDIKTDITMTAVTQCEIYLIT